jgi:hypothetical protein
VVAAEAAEPMVQTQIHPVVETAEAVVDKMIQVVVVIRLMYHRVEGINV